MSGTLKKTSDVLVGSTPAGGGFAGFFSLQSGTVMSSSILFGLALASFIYNLSAPNPTEDSVRYACQYVLSYLFFIVIFFGALDISIAAFKFNTRWVLVGAYVLATAAIIWLVISILSFITSIGVYKYVCVHDRCPPTLWLFEASWRFGSRRKCYTIQVTEDITESTTYPFARKIESMTDDATNFTAGNVTDFESTTERGQSDALNESENDWGLTDYTNDPQSERPKSDWNNTDDLSYRNLPPLSNWSSKVKAFVSSLVLNPEPGNTDGSIGLSIFCFIALSLFWMYSLWTMFSHHKELKRQDKEDLT